MAVIQIQGGKPVAVWPEGRREAPLKWPGAAGMSQFAQATLYGLLQGGLLALIAVGFSLVWGVMNVVNLAHGAFVLAGAYVAFELNQLLGLDPFLGMVPAALVLFGLGYLIQRYVVNLVVNAPIFITLLLTFGLELLAVNGMILLFTANYRSIPTELRRAVVGPARRRTAALRAADRGRARDRHHHRPRVDGAPHAYRTVDPGHRHGPGAARARWASRRRTSTRSRSASPPRWPARRARPSAR